MKENWVVQHDGKPSGILTSVTHSPRLKKNIALAMVSMSGSKIGTNLVVDTPVGTARRIRPTAVAYLGGAFTVKKGIMVKSSWTV
jgi:glycine cleavage system aminomethyltransferase T